MNDGGVACRNGIKGAPGIPGPASPTAIFNSPAMSDTTPFYAYIHYPTDDNVWRMTMIFSNRATADEWWRAVSESSVIQNDLRRITPQYFTHDVAKFNVFNFFVDARIKSISDTFRGRLFLQLENDRGGRGISIIRPSQTICDHVNGNWFYIRSKVEPHIYWYDPSDSDSQRAIVGSYKRRTRFRVTIHASCSGVAPKADAIMINSDLVTIQSRANSYVGPSSGNLSGLVETNTLYTFRFGDLLEGKSVNAVSISSDEAVLSFFTGPDSNPGEFWELA